MDENEARRLAVAFADQHLTMLGKREWKQTRFDHGWVFKAKGEDLRWVTGVPCVVITDDGGVHQDSSSLPPDMLYEDYAPRVPGEPLRERDARRLAMAYRAENLREIGNRPWTATQFEGGWMFDPRGDDLSWQPGVPSLIVTDDGEIHQESSTTPPDERIAKYRSPQS